MINNYSCIIAVLKFLTFSLKIKSVGMLITLSTTILMNDNKNKGNGNESNKIAVSCYFSIKSIERIDDFLFHVKKRLPIEKRRKLSRSVFYEVGLNTAIEEFDKKGEQSELFKAICEALE